MLEVSGHAGRSVAWKSRAPAMPEVIFPDLVIMQYRHSHGDLARCWFSNCLAQSCDFMAGKLKFPLLLSLEEETTAEEQTSWVLALVLPWASWVTSLLKSPRAYPADTEQDAEA